MASSEPGKRANPALYGGMPAAPGPAGMAPRLLEFADELRSEGVAVGTSELLDAFQALDAVSWSSQDDFREALAATLAKSQEDRHVLDVLFDRFFFRAVEREAIDRALPSNPAQDLSEVHRTVAQLKKRLASQGREHRGRRRSWQVDVRRTMRASLQTGGVPLELKYRPKRPRRPELYVLCDVSTSVTSASVFFLSVLHALHDAFRKLRLFVFVERIAEVTDIFERERSFKEISHAIATEPGVADVSGYTDYGRVWLEFHDQIVDELDPRSTVIVLGDARTNGREPQARAFGRVAEHAGRTFWLNPEPRLYWNYGDSVMRAYEPYCDGVFECWTTKQLEQFVNALTDPHAVPPR